MWFFEKFLNCSFQPNLDDLHLDKQLHDADALWLERDFTLEELKEVVFHANPNKAPGIDGMNNKLDQSAWPVIADDLWRATQYF